ncbi:MAG: secretion system protein E [Candidatus Bathyarchaeota archaeon B26-2]|nr:MAG: secretion system protein E [Candidatus Bathyarchaeota archaeon B26-2]
MFRLSKKEKITKEEENKPVEDLMNALKIEGQRLPENYEVVENYPLKPPFSYALILREKDTKELLYFVDEISLDRREQEIYMKLKEVLEAELQAPEDDETPVQSFRRQFPEIIAKHRDVLKDISQVGIKKIEFYLERDILGYGRIDPLMADPLIEDISCSGANKPIYLWHRKYENVKTNVFFGSEEELDDFVMRLVHKAGRHVSIAFPMVDATLPGKHRLAIYYRKEVTPLGTSFTIRKFREDPLTIIDLIQNETISLEVAAYLWLLVENKFSSMIIGATGAGKTTALNAIAGLIHPQQKIITIEEVAEINLPRENWVSTISRAGFGMEDKGEIPLFDLIKSAVRHRPDWIIVGEIRGEEAYVLFQSLATGHGGLCTMHAEDAETAIKRLTQPPMNIPSTIIPLMNCIISVKHVKAPALVEFGRSFSKRKFVKVSEIDSSRRIRDVFVWDSSTDTYKMELSDSYLFERISEKWNLPLEYVYEEFERRKDILYYLAEVNIRSCHEIDEFLNKFYNDPKSTYQHIFESR